MFAQSMKKVVFLRSLARSVVWVSIQHPTRIAASDKRNMFHTCICQFGSNKLMKMLKGERSRKQWYDTPPQKPPSSRSILNPTQKRNPEDSPRLRILNSLLFKAISDLLSSHEVSPELPYLNVEISKVSLSPDYSACRIYWRTSGTSGSDAKIQQLLDKSGRRIRYLLTSQQVIGFVPVMVFIRDKRYEALNEIDNLLKVADFGPDELVETSSVKEGRVESHSYDYADQQQQFSERKRPVLFGVDHDALLKQIQEYKQQARDAPAQAPSAALTQQQLDAFAKFRKQKQIEKKKKKSKKMIDDDITPEAYLLAKHSEQEPMEDWKDDYSEDVQIRELMAEDNRKP